MLTMPTPVVNPETFTGTFISQADPPEFDDQSAHPIIRYVKGDIAGRERSIIQSTKVEALLFVSDRKLFSVYLPRLTYDSVCDPNEETPIISGALGSICSKAIPVSLDAEQAFADVFVLVPFTEDIRPHFLTGAVLPPELFNAPDRPDAPLVLPSTDYSEYSIIRFPLALPKVSGEPILEGPLVDEHVVSSIMNYNTTAHAWLEIHALLLSKDASILSPDTARTLDEQYRPPSTESIRMVSRANITINILLETNDPACLHASVKSLIDSKMRANRKHHQDAHPEQYQTVPSSPAPQPRANIITPPHPSSAPSPSPNADSFAFQGLNLPKKYERPLHTFQALLCAVDEHQHIVLPKLRASFLQCFQQPSAQETSRYALMAMQQHDSERSANSRDYLLRQISPLNWNQTTVTLFLQALFHTAPFEENKVILKSKISFLTFLPHPPESQSPDLQKYLQDNHVEQMQILIGESNENKQKLSLHTFHGGMRKKIAHVLSGIANLESRLSFVVDYSNSSTPKPLLVTWLLQFANLFSSTEFKEFWDKYICSHPWLAHAMSNQIYVLFSLLAKSASNLNVQQAIQDTNTFPISALQLPIKAFTSMLNDIHIACSGTSPVSYASKPLSYHEPALNHTKRKLDLESHSSSSTKRVLPSGSPPNRGWIESTRKIMWPKELSGKQLCTRFAQLGSSCPNGTNCPYQHKIFPKDFAPNDVDIICRMVDSSSYLKFSPNVIVPKRPPTPSKPNTFHRKEVSFSKQQPTLKHSNTNPKSVPASASSE